MMTDIVERARAAQHSILPQPELIKELADEVERLFTAAQAVPEGWKLVPIEPTAEMIETGCENNPTMFNEGTDNGFAADVANDVYVAMVRAAPAMTSAQRNEAKP